MQVYYRYGFWFLASLPLAVASLAWGWLDYVYLLVFLLASSDLIFVRESKDYSQTASSFNHYQFFSRVNILNLCLTVWLSLTLLIYALGIKTLRILPLVLSWALMSYVLQRYIVKIGLAIERWLFRSYLTRKLPELPASIIALALRDYPKALPAPKTLASLLKIEFDQAEKLTHYYQVYESVQRKNN